MTMTDESARNGNKLRLAVLVSGGGTNLQALIDRQAAGTLSAEIAVVASDRADAFGLVRAQRAGIPTRVVDYGTYLRLNDAELERSNLPVGIDELDRTQKILRHIDPERRIRRLSRLVLAEKELIRKLDEHHPDLICLAGFMRLVTPYFLGRYNQGMRMRVLNIHPALLPAFPGQHGYEDTFAYGCKWGGVTVHFVDEGEDTGPIIAQAVYPVWPGDDIEAIRRRGLELEYEVYAQCINWLAAGQVKMLQGESIRSTAVIQDPSYPVIVKNWLQKSTI